jgi:exodeoxyribonuclease V alpha subunit
MMAITDKQQRLKQKLTRGDIRAIDFAFAMFIADEYPLEPEPLIDIAAYLSFQSGLQHVCVPIADMQFSLFPSFADIEDLKSFVEVSPAILCLSDAENQAERVANYPIIFQGSAFYLQRYWVYETSLIQHLSRLNDQTHDYDRKRITPLLEVLFPGETAKDDEIDWQKIAVTVAAMNPVTFITGGPGTGKTTTVVKLIALLQQLSKEEGKQNVMIKLAAPTGKAAARLSDSIALAARYLPAHLSEGLDIRSTTIHRLLGANYQSIHFVHDYKNPIHADLIVLDEASMIDLPMMSKFFAAVPSACRVVLLGDSEQLASVEVGTVLNDICALSERISPSTAFIQTLAQITQVDLSNMMRAYNKLDDMREKANPSRLVNGITRLYKSHRFDAKSEIGQLAQAVKTKDVSSVFGLLNSSISTQLRWFQSNELENLMHDVLPLLIAYCHAVVAGDLKQAFALFKQQQILCSHKSGRWGVEQVNRRIEYELAKRAILVFESQSYSGRPIMIARNSSAQNLFNGDIGIIANDPINGNLLKAWFETNDGEIRGILLNQLPEHETVFAMTVHKSQGSEYDKVVLCLPYEKAKHIHLTRSLLYTGLTRSKSELTLFASKEAVTTAISTDVKRGSGLANRLALNEAT